MYCVFEMTIEALENAGCNNGNYPRVELKLSNGKVLHGNTCKCQSGCSNTWRLQKGSTHIFDLLFENESELYSFLES